MDFLKWVVSTSLLVAMMFLGLKSEPQNDDASFETFAPVTEFVEPT